MSWTDYLYQPSWRGVPFCVTDEEGEAGRRNAVHKYPKKDTAWIEDMGCDPQHIVVTGFLIGDDVTEQLKAMIAVSEMSGEGLLVHPIFGQMTVSMGKNLHWAYRKDSGRVIDLHFDFIEGGKRQYPTVIIVTGDAVTVAADSADSAAGADFAKILATDLKQGAIVAQKVAGTVAIWARTAQRLGNSVTNLSHLVSSLSGNYGRYASGKKVSGLDKNVSGIVSTTTTINSLVLQGTQSRTHITAATNVLTTIANGLGL